MRRTRRPFLPSFLITAAVLSACASSGGSAPEQAQPRQVVRIAGTELSMSSTSNVSVMKVPAAVDKVWAVLPAAYDSLGIQVLTLLPAERMIGNEVLKIRQRLGKTSLSRYLSCGETQMGPSADSYEIQMSVLTVAKPDDAATTLETKVEATARPVNFSQVPSKCSSKGLLEERITEMARKLAAR